MTVQFAVLLLGPRKHELQPRVSCARPLRAGRKQYARAVGLFLHGLTAPTQVVNAITVATYKKYALVSLIHMGAMRCCTLDTKNPNPCAADAISAINLHPQRLSDMLQLVCGSVFLRAP